MNTATAPEVPLYRSHKLVRALRIISVVRTADGGAVITPGEDGHRPFDVPAEYVEKHAPKAGGYFVQYEDGYQSWSPAEAFEQGYSRVPQQAEVQPPPANMAFGTAMEYLKGGARIARAGWNGKGMFIYLNEGSHYFGAPSQSSHIAGVPARFFVYGDAGTVTRLPNINMRAADGCIVTGWLASQTDLLAEDWNVV